MSRSSVAGGLGGVQPADGARDGDAGLERVEAGQVRDRDDAAALEVDPAVVVELQPAAEPGRRREVGGRAGQAADEVGVVRAPGARSRPAAARSRGRRPRGGSRTRPPPARGGCGRGAPGSRGTPAPIPTRESRHCAVSGQHLGVVGAEAAAGEARVDLRGDVGEVGVDLGAAGVGVGERVVLVGGQRRLPAGGRAEREPRPRARAPAPRSAAISSIRRMVAVSDWSAITRPTSSGETPARIRLTIICGRWPARLDELVDARGVGDRPPQRKRRAALEVHQVGRGDDAERRPGRVDDRAGGGCRRRACRSSRRRPGSRARTSSRARP